MKEYTFPIKNEINCKRSVIVFFIIIISILLITPHTSFGYLLLLVIIFPPFIYVMLRQSTGFIRYDSEVFEIKNTVWLGNKIKSDWINLDRVGINSKIDNVILGFGKKGFTSFSGNSKEFKQFIIDMLRTAQNKKDINKINESVYELINFTDDDIDKIIENNKPNVMQEAILPVLYTLIVIAGMLGFVLLFTKHFYHVPFYQKNIKLLAPILVFLSFLISSKIIGIIWNLLYKNEEKKD